MIYSYNFTNIQVSAYQQAKDNNEYNGDSYITIETDEYFVCAIADGLGSGELAKDSADAAIYSIKKTHDQSVERMLDEANQALYGKRGVVMAVFKINYKTMELSFSGVGNIYLVLYFENGDMIRPVAYSGYLSGKPQKYRVERLSVEKPIFFLMYSDGFKVNLKNKDIFKRMKSPESAVHYIKDCLVENKDDVTYLIGKME